MSYAELLGEAMAYPPGWEWSLGVDRYQQLSYAVAQCLNDSDCTTVNRVAMWCAQIGHESSGLRYMEEIADGSAYEGREDLGNTEPGDGCRYKGRGPIMVTGRHNYTVCSDWAFSQSLVPNPTFFVDLPEQMASDTLGFTGTTWYWTTQRPMNDACDAGDVDLATYYINGGYNGLDDRTARWNHCLSMGERIMGLTDQAAAGAPPPPPPPPFEKVLAYDHSIVPQETGYWCGPASTQVVLNAQGIYVTEQDLANQMGTDQGGTDYVGLIEDTLDRYVPHMDYRERYLEQDPITQQQKDDLWLHVTNSILGGAGVPMNWVAPTSNYPRGTRGSVSPAYGGGTVFHYVACMGFYEGPDGRHCWIADSGFAPFGYWCSFDQVATLIPPKGYTASGIPAAPPPPPAAGPPDYVLLGYEQLCGLIGENGYGQGWSQLGQNAAGQNLYVVDALAAILDLVQKIPRTEGASVVPSTAGLDYARLEYEQLAGIITEDGYGHGWPQLQNMSITDAVAEIKNVLSGTTPPPEPPPTGGTPGGKHALLTCAGTWAAPGVGYPSDVAQACADVVEEIPVQAPWSMGPITGGGTMGQAPSYQESIQIGVDWAVGYLLANPTRTFLLGGYSQGGECVSRIHQETLPGGRLESVRANFVGGYTFGNPSRQAGHTFYLGPPRPDEGIAQYRQADMGDDWADECDDGDMYSGVPLGLAGEIMRDVYTMITEMQLHEGFAEFARDFAYNCVELLGNLDGDAGEDAKAQAARFGVSFEGAHRVDGLMARFGSDDRFVSVQGIAAAIQAAIIAITFFAQGTAPHIEYHSREVFPGQTYVQHAIQHVRHWAAQRVPMQ